MHPTSPLPLLQSQALLELSEFEKEYNEFKAQNSSLSTESAAGFSSLIKKWNALVYSKEGAIAILNKARQTSAPKALFQGTQNELDKKYNSLLQKLLTDYHTLMLVGVNVKTVTPPMPATPPTPPVVKSGLPQADATPPKAPPPAAPPTGDPTPHPEEGEGEKQEYELVVGGDELAVAAQPREEGASPKAKTPPTPPPPSSRPIGGGEGAVQTSRSVTIPLTAAASPQAQNSKVYEIKIEKGPDGTSRWRYREQPQPQGQQNWKSWKAADPAVPGNLAENLEKSFGQLAEQLAKLKQEKKLPPELAGVTFEPDPPNTTKITMTVKVDPPKPKPDDNLHAALDIATGALEAASNALEAKKNAAAKPQQPPPPAHPAV